MLLHPHFFCAAAERLAAAKRQSGFSDRKAQGNKNFGANKAPRMARVLHCDVVVFRHGALSLSGNDASMIETSSCLPDIFENVKRNDTLYVFCIIARINKNFALYATACARDAASFSIV
jgi:hypothetical protein